MYGEFSLNQNKQFNRVTALEKGIEYLYKFRSLNDHDLKDKHTEKIITQSKIHFASISEFNDPFDSHCYFYTDLPIKDRFNFLYESFKPFLDGPLWKRKFGFTSKDISFGNDYDIMYRKFISDRLIESGDIKGNEDAFYAIVNKSGIFSMSKTNNNILLWSHYANSHTGICIQFKVDNDYFGHASEVSYSEEYPKIDYLRNFKDDLNQADRALLTKSALWHYEEEYRIILVAEHPKNPFTTEDIIIEHHGEQDFPEHLLTGVIFGCWTSNENKKLVKEWVKERKIKPALYQAEPKEKEFGLDIKPIQY